MPERVQLSRRKGWRLPANTVSVARPGKFGNPFTVTAVIEAGYSQGQEKDQAFVVDRFREWLNGNNRWWMGAESEKARQAILDGLPSLRGKNLACWCRPGTPCHADVLQELANG